MNFISRKKASELLCVSQKTIDRMLRDGRIKGFKPYNSTRVFIYEDSITEHNLKSKSPVFENDFK